MASLELRKGWYRIVFRIDGEKFSRSLNTESKQSANACLARVKDNLHRYELGLLAIPERQDIVDVIMGSRPKKTDFAYEPGKLKSITIKNAWRVFQDTLPINSLESSTLSGMTTHVGHLARLIGKRVTLSQIDKKVFDRSWLDHRMRASSTILFDPQTRRVGHIK